MTDAQMSLPERIRATDPSYLAAVAGLGGAGLGALNWYMMEPDPRAAALGALLGGGVSAAAVYGGAHGNRAIQEWIEAKQQGEGPGGLLMDKSGALAFAEAYFEKLAADEDLVGQSATDPSVLHANDEVESAKRDLEAIKSNPRVSHHTKVEAQLRVQKAKERLEARKQKHWAKQRESWEKPEGLNVV